MLGGRNKFTSEDQGPCYVGWRLLRCWREKTTVIRQQRGGRIAHTPCNSISTTLLLLLMLYIDQKWYLCTERWAIPYPKGLYSSCLSHQNPYCQTTTSSVHWQEGDDHKITGNILLVPKLKDNSIKKQPPNQLALTAGMAGWTERRENSPTFLGKLTGISAGWYHPQSHAWIHHSARTAVK